MPVKIQFKRGEKSAWESQNPVLEAGEVGVDLTDLVFKIGDGTTTWSGLSYHLLQDTSQALNLKSIESISGILNSELLLYSKGYATRHLPSYSTSGSSEASIQPSLAGNGFYLILPGSTTVMNVLGGPAVSTAGTVSHPTSLSPDNLLTQSYRTTFTTATGVGSVSSARSAFARCWRGDFEGYGGVFYLCRFGLEAVTSGTRFLAGLSNTTGALASGTIPSTQINSILVGFDGGDANFNLITGDGATPTMKLDLGADFPATTTGILYEFTVFIPPTTDKIMGYSLKNVSSGIITEGIVYSELPVSTQFLNHQSWITNSTVSGSVAFSLLKVYIETDY